MYSKNIWVTRGSDTSMGSRYAYWYFQIDGSKCARPGNNHIFFLYESKTHYYSRSPDVLTGICSANSAGKLFAGIHVITVSC